MNRLALQVTFVLVLTLSLIWSVWPLNKSLRLGKDLRGGVSLVYSVKMPPDAQPELVLKQVIDVLKQRVNPTGVLDISFVPQGRDRIEVVMPLPGSDVRQKQLTFRQTLTELVKKSGIDAVELGRHLQEGTTAQRFGATDSAFKEKMTRLQSAYDLAKTSKDALQQATQSGANVAEAEMRWPRPSLRLKHKWMAWLARA